MKKIYYSWEQVQGAVLEIARQMQIHNWRPDYVVGITRGGLVPANLISQYLAVPMETLKVSLRDGGEPESNLWMAEDAFNGKKILIVDDINDTGATFNWIMKDWPSGCFPDDPTWENEVWNQNVKFAVLVDNLASQCTATMDYVGMEVNKAEKDVWVDFPWEDWWTK